MHPKNILNADLHCHSVVSDGTLTPEVLAERAKTNGVELWALTDHDEIGGQHRARAAALALGMDYLTGVEISVTFVDTTVHIVGLGFDADDARLVQGLAEAIAFGQRAGLDMPQVLDVIGKGAAQSWQMDNRGPTMVEGQFDFGFAIDWMRKDLGLVLDEARRNGARLPVTALVDQFYADLQAQGANRLDTSSLIKRLR